jgi:hypothetical protein
VFEKLFEPQNIPFVVAGAIWIALLGWLVYKYLIIDRR